MKNFSGKDQKPQPDTEKLQGTWKIASTVEDGEELKEVGEWTFNDLKIKIRTQRKDMKFAARLRFRLDETTKPKVIDVVAEGRGAEDQFVPGEWDQRLKNEERMQGIYSIDGDTLKICISLRRDEQPTAFESKQLGYLLIVLKKESPKDEQKKGNKSDKP